MQVLRRSRARILVMFLAFFTIAACGGDSPTGVGELAGTYVATRFQVTPDGEGPIDVLAAGGTLTVTLTASNAVTGTLFIPGSLTGEGDMNASMAGTWVRDGNTLEVQQTADTFVRDLTWAIGTNQLTVAGQRAGVAIFTITLTRQ